MLCEKDSMCISTWPCQFPCAACFSQSCVLPFIRQHMSGRVQRMHARVTLPYLCRLLNLELLLQFGPRAWQAHIRHLEVAQQG